MSSLLVSLVLLGVPFHCFQHRSKSREQGKAFVDVIIEVEAVWHKSGVNQAGNNEWEVFPFKYKT